MNFTSAIVRNLTQSRELVIDTAAAVDDAAPQRRLTTRPRSALTTPIRRDRIDLPPQRRSEEPDPEKRSRPTSQRPAVIGVVPRRRGSKTVLTTSARVSPT